ncbi:L-serine ammonia-lyase [Cellulomonas sp. NPDC089187]|uniref:L-serine ammonia-lyase n=1 Tax=Cellulomonas sp. NPDC089187 TaxID=3154970 RepID=UPI0034469C9F
MSGVYVSALELFSIGIGPSSSHTVGPMRAAHAFITELREHGLLGQADRLHIRLHGSLAATGIGHGTPDAVLAGLRGMEPETCDPAAVHGRWAELSAGGTLEVEGITVRAEDVAFEPFARDLGHPNALTLAATRDGEELWSSCYLSIGGGFILRAGARPPEPTPVPSTYRTATQLLEAVGENGRIADVAWADEVALHGEAEATRGLDAIWAAMSACVAAGVSTEGVLPGGLRVRRRAAAAQRALDERVARGERVAAEERLAVWAMAINEENAAGGRVVTAPTNGAAGVLPAVLHYLVNEHGADRDAVHTFLLTAAAIGSIVKANASISGAEAGCQGEVGSACAMAAAGTTAVLGGTPRQVENAAEIAMEHHLGLTCDPVGGLVQIPCIERNAVAAATALTAARIALLGDGQHVVSLDTVIETMRQTGADMSSRYKETSEAGLAVNVVEC